MRDRDFVAEYAARAPLALALERAMECQLYRDRDFARPVLDVGCGDGTFAEVLFGPSHVDHGLDADPLELARARRRAIYRELHAAYADQIPLPEESISTVLSNSTLEHIHDLRPVLAEIFRVLRRGGRLYMTVPTDRFERYSALYRALTSLRLRLPAERFRRFYNSFWRHHHAYPPARWRSLVESVGLEPEEIIEFDGRASCTAHDLLVPAALPAYLLKKRLGRYFLLPWLRRAAIAVARPLLPPNKHTPVPAGTGGLVFLVAQKPK